MKKISSYCNRYANYKILEVDKYLAATRRFRRHWENIIHTDGDELPEETKALIAEYLHPKLKKMI